MKGWVGQRTRARKVVTSVYRPQGNTIREIAGVIERELTVASGGRRQAFYYECLPAQKARYYVEHSDE